GHRGGRDGRATGKQRPAGRVRRRQAVSGARDRQHRPGRSGAERAPAPGRNPSAAASVGPGRARPAAADGTRLARCLRQPHAGRPDQRQVSPMRLPPDTLAPEVSFHAVRSRGPGGQNVNKVASCALVTWNFDSSTLLTPEEKSRLREKLARSLNSSGEIQLRSDEFRDLTRNKARALEKLAERVDAALAIPRP